MWSRDIHISNVTFRDSPFWNLHPYDCQNVTIKGVTILAPLSGAPNTDGIDPGQFKSPLHIWLLFPIFHLYTFLKSRKGNHSALDFILKNGHCQALNDGQLHKI